MTLINHTFSRPGPLNIPIPVTGIITCQPTRKRVITGTPDNTVLPAPFPHVFSGTLKNLNLAPTNGEWCWKLTYKIPGVTTWEEHVLVPETVSIDLTDLVRVNPDSLNHEPEAQSIWWAKMDELLKLGGVPGKDGKDGVDGKDGRNGIDGKDGRDGSNGTNGRDGIDGSNGNPGSDGVDGKDAPVFDPVTWNMSSPNSTGADMRQQETALPRLTETQVLVTDVGRARTGDGAKFFTVIRVGDKPGTWLDEYYGYVTGHDSHFIWLMSAPTIEGPWKWEKAIIGHNGTNPLPGVMKATQFQQHIASPDAMWVNGKIHLYFHGHAVGVTDVQQPTGLATSTDGQAFTMQPGYSLKTTRDTDQGRYDGVSTSYARFFAVGNMLHAVWQSERVRWTQSEDMVRTYAVTAGHGVSADGINWRILPPLALNRPGDRGVYGPSVVRMADGSWLMFVTYKQGVDAGDFIQVMSSPTLTGNTWITLGALRDEVGPLTVMNSPMFVHSNGRLKVIYGVKTADMPEAEIRLSTVSWTK